MKPSIESLEPRIAPASVLVFTDVDGDRVKITASAGNLNAGGVATLVDFGTLGGQKLALLNLTDASFQGAKISTSVTRGAHGDGLVNIGRIDATGRDLFSVSITGDLGVIDVGDANTNTLALRSLMVRSMGTLGLASQDGGVDLISNFNGSLGGFLAFGDVRGATLDVVGSIGPVTLGGSLIGTDTELSGTILATGDIGNVKINGDVQGGTAIQAGGIFSSGRIGSINIGGSLIGGTTNGTGSIRSQLDMGPVNIAYNIIGGGESSGILGPIQGKTLGISVGGSLIGGYGPGSGNIIGSSIGLVKIGHDVRGGSADGTGIIEGTIGFVKIGGSIFGGSTNSGTLQNSGGISSAGDIGSIAIGGDLVGGTVAGEASLRNSGFIQVDGRLGSVFIGHSIISGNDFSTSTVTNSGSIRVGEDLGSVLVRGNLIGHESSPVIISAVGQETPSGNIDLAIGKITIGGRVDLSLILGGFGPNDTPDNGSNGNASIGRVDVGGDWYASSISAGINQSGLGFGDGGTIINNPPGAPTDSIVARIASITIRGSVLGAPDPFFQTGFTAQQIGSFRAGQYVAPLTSATDPSILLAPYTGNVNLLEIPVMPT